MKDFKPGDRIIKKGFPNNLGRFLRYADSHTIPALVFVQWDREIDFGPTYSWSDEIELAPDPIDVLIEEVAG